MILRTPKDIELAIQKINDDVGKIKINSGPVFEPIKYYTKTDVERLIQEAISGIQSRENLESSSLGSQVDSVPQGANIAHFLKHIFYKAIEFIGDITTAGKIYCSGIDIRNSITQDQFHLSFDNTSQGLHIINRLAGETSYFIQGSYFITATSEWIATNTTACFISVGPAGLRIFHNSGLTVGAPFVPNLIGILSPTGWTNLIAPLAINQGGTGATTAAGARTNLGITGDVGIAYANTNVVLTVTNQDIPGATLVTTKTGTYSISGVFDVFGTGVGDFNAIFLGALSVNGTNQPNIATKSLGPTATYNDRATIAQNWVLPLSAGTTLKLQCQKSGGTGGSITSTHCSLMVQCWG